MTFFRDEQAHQLARAREHHEPGAARTLVDGTDQWAKIFGLLLRAHHQISHDRKKSFRLAKISESLGCLLTFAAQLRRCQTRTLNLKLPWAIFYEHSVAAFVDEGSFMRRITTVATIYVTATAMAAKKYGLAYHRKSLCCLLVLKRPKLLSAP